MVKVWQVQCDCVAHPVFDEGPQVTQQLGVNLDLAFKRTVLLGYLLEPGVTIIYLHSTQLSNL